MELKQIKELMTAMERTGTKRCSLKREGEYELTLERAEQTSKKTFSINEETEENPLRTDMEHHRALTSPSRTPLEKGVTRKGEQDETSVSGNFITSPMVGTFYLCPSPDDPPFVKVGDRIEKDTVVCIIEAMKVMNEVKAGVSGIVAAVLMDTGHPVEFGTKLFRITE